MKKYWVLICLLFVTVLLFAQNRANYDTHEYEPVKLKPFKTHPNTFVPEEVELEPDLEPNSEPNSEPDLEPTPVSVKEPSSVSVKEPSPNLTSETTISANNQNATQSQTLSEVAAEEPPCPYVYLPEGKSKAFSITPVEGVTISAEENALDKDREFTMKELPEKEVEDFSNKLNSEKKEFGCVINVWELHAGMADNEILPGTFKMEFDLEKLGVLPEFYQNVACYRIDDQGNWFEYVTHKNGNRAWVDSRQNSNVVLTVKGTLILAFDSDKKIIKIVTDKNDKTLDYLDDLYRVRYPDTATGTIIWNIEYDPVNVKFGSFDFKLEDINQLKAALNFLYIIKKIDYKAPDEMVKEFENVPGKRELLIRQFQEKYIQDLNTLSKFKELSNKLAKLCIDFVPIAKKIKNSAQIACNYYYEVIFKNKDKFGLTPFTYCPAIKIVKEDIIKKTKKLLDPNYKGRDADTPGFSSKIRIPYKAIEDNREQEYNNFIITICHEMFHVIQHNSYPRFRHNVKWDEATAQYFEDEALEYFQKNGIIPADYKSPVDNGIRLELYTIPIDSYAGYVDLGYGVRDYYFYGPTGIGDLGYPLSHFLRYINERKNKELKGYKDKRWHDFCNCFHWYSNYPDFTTLIYKVFNIDKKEASNYYIDFAKDFSDKFYKIIRANEKDEVENSDPPKLLLGGIEPDKNGQRIYLFNEDYTIRLRKIYSYTPSNYFDDENNKVALQIVLDSDFKTIMPDRDFKPVGPEIATATQIGGFFYYPTNPLTLIKIMEQKNEEIGKIRQQEEAKGIPRYKQTRFIDKIQYEGELNYKKIGNNIVQYFYLLEIDGGSDEVKLKSRENLQLKIEKYKQGKTTIDDIIYSYITGPSVENKTSGYTIWTMLAPVLDSSKNTLVFENVEKDSIDFETVVEVIESKSKSKSKAKKKTGKEKDEKELEEKVCLQLPEKSDVAKIGKCVDGYMVRLKIDKEGSGDKVKKEGKDQKAIEKKYYFSLKKNKEDEKNKADENNGEVVQKVYFDYEELIKAVGSDEIIPLTGKLSIAEYVLGSYTSKLDGSSSENSNYEYDKKTGHIILEGPESKEIEFALSPLNIEMVKCNPGTFMMGSPKKKVLIGSDDESDEFDEELLHDVKITMPFYIGKYEITQKQFEKVMGYNPSKYNTKDPDVSPVETVSWKEAEDFCEKLNKAFAYTISKELREKGYKYALPTEAQWEYACRAGTTTSLNSGKEIVIDEAVKKNIETSKKLDEDMVKYPYSEKRIGMIGAQKAGNIFSTIANIEKLESDNLDEVAWYKYNSKRKPHSVGQKKPNAWGIYDMHGNVSEWCCDWFNNYKKSSQPIEDPFGKKDTYEDKGEIVNARIIRGGSFADIAIACRSASRACLAENINEKYKDYLKVKLPELEGKIPSVGFRVVLISKEEQDWRRMKTEK